MTVNIDHIFIKIDEEVARLEDDGYPFNVIIQVMQDYVDLSNDCVINRE
jgi:hypothetical protein|tara:strand:+ start:120 stop:266 length:147 start_codon:yes stop_codon:yes gene_type:complete